MNAMDPSSSYSRQVWLTGTITQDRQAGFTRSDGMWAALSSPHYPSSHMSKVRSCHYFSGSSELLDFAADPRSSSAVLSELPLLAPSTPIQAAPGYRRHEPAEEADRSFQSMRHGQSAPMDISRPSVRWKSYRRIHRAKNGRRCGRNEAEQEAIDDAETLEEVCRAGSGDGEQRRDEEADAGDEEEEEEEEEERLPPHEMLEREWATVTKSGGAAFSLCQGIGRTLKGRDLCRVRNSILKQTGFL